MKVAALVSGTGTNLTSLLDAIDRGKCAAEVVGVVSDKAKAPALDVARNRSIPTTCVRLRDCKDRATWDEQLAEATSAFAPDMVLLAGFMRIVGEPLLTRFPSRIVNVHPSLLPSFPGKDGPTLAIEAGVRLSGCTVHVVDRGVDSGAILAQAAVPVMPADDRAALHARIQAVEHRLVPAVIHWIATGILELGPPVRWTRWRADEAVAWMVPHLDLQDP